MYQSAPARSRQSYRHEAFLWGDAQDFTEGLVRFVEDGLAADEPVMLALVQEHSDWVRDGLGTQASEVTFVDMGALGRNPARIVSAWQQFLDSRSGGSRPARGVGEPVWAGRRVEEVIECQLHEALLNVALDPKTPFWLVCPYDAKHLDESVIAEAHCSHHAVFDAQSYRGSTTYGGRAHVDLLFGADLPHLSGDPVEWTFTYGNVADVFAFVMREACAANLWSDKALDLASAARRLAVDTLHRGGDRGMIRIWDQSSALICEVSDQTVIEDVLAGRRSSSRDLDRGLWSANQSCDLVQMRSSPSGTTVRLHSWK